MVSGSFLAVKGSVSLIVLAAWSVFVWASRIRNVLADDELTTAGTTWRLAAAVVFVAGGLTLGYAIATKHPWLRQITLLLAAWTTAWWLVRGIGILADANHDASFKAVHTVLMLVSLGLAGWAVAHIRQTAPAT
ncbi:hypothetical protein JYT71_00845 [Acidimicrobiaceae bacterium AH-315-P05]|nr:hypothetical protein [Acidimicrobiaceae bacterium AH-315-P05]